MIEQYIITFLPSLLLIIETIIGIFSVIKPLRRINVEKEVKKANKKLEDELEVLLSDNAQLRKDNLKLMEKISEKEQKNGKVYTVVKK